MVKRTLDVQFDELVIGANLSALSYAYNRKLPLVYTRLQRPYIHQVERKDEDYNRFNNLMYIMSFKSLVPFYNAIDSLRIEDAYTVKGFTKSNIMIKMQVNKLTIADDHKLEGLQPYSYKTSNEILLLDHFTMVPQFNNGYTYIPSTDTVFNSVHFYKQLSASSGYNCLTVTKTTEDMKNEFDVSQTVVRIQLHKLLKSLGFKNHWDASKNRHKPLQLHDLHREVVPLGVPIYEDIPGNHKYIWQEEETDIPELTVETIGQLLCKN